MAHVDDFLVLGRPQELRWLGKNLRETYDTKSQILERGPNIEFTERY